MCNLSSPNRVLKYTTLNVERGTRNAETLKDSTFDVLHSTFRLRFSAACETLYYGSHRLRHAWTLRTARQPVLPGHDDLRRRLGLGLDGRGGRGHPRPLPR